MKIIRFMLLFCLAFSLFSAAVAIFKFGYWLASFMPNYICFAVVFFGCIVTAFYWNEEGKS